MKYCSRCCYPENTRPTMMFDENGVCSGCIAFENRQTQDVDWEVKKQELQELLDEYKQKARKNNSPYDCIIPVSGGKDSHYQAHLLTKVFKMRPLFVTYNHAYNTKLGIRNLTNMLEKFGCDLLRYSTNPVTARKLSSFMLSKVGDITWHYHAGIMTFPIQTAVRYKIPLIVWGDHGESMYFGRNNLSDNVEFTKKNRQEHLMRGFEPEDILDDPENKEITRQDLGPFFYPSDEEIESIGVRGIYLSNYDPFNFDEHTKFVIENYGFETMQEREAHINLHEKTDDFMQDTHNYLKYLKFGYGRITDQVSIHIRERRMSREEGIDWIERKEYLKRPKNLDVFLKFVGLTESEFLDKIEHLRDETIWEKKSNGKWELLDWIGNHKNDEFVEKVRLEKTEEWKEIRSEKSKMARDYLEEDEIVFL